MNQEYFEKAKKLAIMIFNEYLKKGAPYEVQLEDFIKCTIYQRFGCIFNEDDSHERRNTNREKNDQVFRNKSLMGTVLTDIRENLLEDQHSD